MEEHKSFFGSVKDAEDIAAWCKAFGIVNEQPEITRAGELIDILFEKVCRSAVLIGEYSNDAEKATPSVRMR